LFVGDILISYEKIITVFALFLFVFGATSSFAAGEPHPKYPIAKKLSKGMCDQEVYYLQDYLDSHKYLSLKKVYTGYFGPQTVAAVKKMQKDNGIKATGAVGPATLAFLSAEQSKYKTPELQPGEHATGLIPTAKCVYDKIPVAKF
jgi:peptidoglycan hydrolase-like protein with peptidoglycan-binding domain